MPGVQHPDSRPTVARPLTRRALAKRDRTTAPTRLKPTGLHERSGRLTMCADSCPARGLCAAQPCSNASASCALSSHQTGEGAWLCAAVLACSQPSSCSCSLARFRTSTGSVPCRRGALTRTCQSSEAQHEPTHALFWRAWRLTEQSELRRRMREHRSTLTPRAATPHLPGSSLAPSVLTYCSSAPRAQSVPERCVDGRSPRWPSEQSRCNLRAPSSTAETAGCALTGTHILSLFLQLAR